MNVTYSCEWKNVIIIISSRLFHTQYAEGFYFIDLLKITAMPFISITIKKKKKNKLDFAPVQ